MELPEYILSDDWLAIIVPGFQYQNKIANCSPFQECIEKWVIIMLIYKLEYCLW